MPAFKGFKPFKRHDQQAKDEKAIAQYEKVKELGRGGFAVVHQVHKKGQDRGTDIAMRIVPLRLVLTGPTVWTIDDLRRRLNWALGITSNLKSSHILGFFEYRITKEDLVTFSELCRGGDLFDKIINSPDGHFSEDEARDATRNLCEAIVEVHGVGTIHRDIKPENVFYRAIDSPAADVVLADFGCCIAQTTREALHTGSAGSPGYLAPEMVAGQPYNMLVDEWSLGITVYEMLSGRSPMLSTEPADLARETLERDIPYPARYWKRHSHEAKDFVHSLLQKDPKKRMSVEAALKHPWLVRGKIMREGSTSTTSSDGMGPDPSAPLQQRKTLKSMVNNETKNDVVGGIAFGGGHELAGMQQYCTRQVLAGEIESPNMSRCLQSIPHDGSTSGTSSASRSSSE